MPLPTPSLQITSPTTEDVEAAARMVASENPSAGKEVWIEQIWTQIREAREHKTTLHRQITGGHGYGPQGKGLRPVATTKEAAEEHRQVAREVLSGAHPSKLEGAKRFWDPRQQDAIFRQVQKGLADKAAGKPITKRTQELIDVGYKRDAEGVRKKWRSEGKALVGVLGPVEFWT